MTLKNSSIIHLKPVFALFGYTAAFEEEAGSYSCEISAMNGDVEFIHHSYDVETGTWEHSPESEPEKILIKENETKQFHFTCKKQNGQADCILISNHSYLKPADFICRFRKTG